MPQAIDYAALADQARSGLLTPGNIDMGTRPRVKNPDGSTSTVRSMSVNMDGREVLIPTVSDDGRVLSNDDAIANYKRTGKHLGMFDTPDNATAFAKKLHESEAAKLNPPAVDYAALAQQARSSTGEVSATDAYGNVRTSKALLDPSRKPASAEDFTAPAGRPSGRFGAYSDIGNTVEDLAVGAGKKLADEGIRGGALLRKIPGVNALDRLMTPIEVNTAPANTTQKVGGALEQVAEVVNPSRAISSIAANTAERVAPRLVASIGERLATALPRAAVEGAGGAALAAAQGGNPLVGGAAGAILSPIASVAEGASGALRDSAEKKVMQALGPTKERFKAMAERLTPGILQRGLRGSREQLQAHAAETASEVGQQIDDAIQQFGSREVSAQPIHDALEKAKSAFQTTRQMPLQQAIREGYVDILDSGHAALRKGAKMLPDGSVETAVVFEPRAVSQLNGIQKVITDLGDAPRVDQLVAVRRAWDKVVADAGGYAHRAPGAIGQPLKDISEAANKREATKAIRAVLNDQVPELGALNKEYAFWKGLDDVLGQTLQRTAPRGEGLVATTKEAAGQVAGAAMKGGGIGGAFALGKVARLANAVFTSPRWRLASAQTRDALASAIANNNASEIARVLSQISAVGASKVPAAVYP